MDFAWAMERASAEDVLLTVTAARSFSPLSLLTQCTRSRFSGAPMRPQEAGQKMLIQQSLQYLNLVVCPNAGALIQSLI